MTYKYEHNCNYVTILLKRTIDNMLESFSHEFRTRYGPLVACFCLFYKKEQKMPQLVFVEKQWLKRRQIY